jgi:hypothetical protein
MSAVGTTPVVSTPYEESVVLTKGAAAQEGTVAAIEVLQETVGVDSGWSVLVGAP